MFDTKHLIDSNEFDLNIGSIADDYHNIRHPFDIGSYEAEELHQEDMREQKRVMFQNVLPLHI